MNGASGVPRDILASSPSLASLHPSSAVLRLTPTRGSDRPLRQRYLTSPSVSLAAAKLTAFVPESCSDALRRAQPSPAGNNTTRTQFGVWRGSMLYGTTFLRRWIPPGPFRPSMPCADGSSSENEMRRCRWLATSDAVRRVLTTVSWRAQWTSALPPLRSHHLSAGALGREQPMR